MISFYQFITEGGNVQIGDEFADRIDLRQVSRSEIVPKLEKGLKEINKEFKKMFGISLWTEELFKNKAFLSGSAFHFFDRAIEDKKFATHKPTVGDIDTQVDKTMKNQIKEFLDNFSGSAGPLKYIGYKSSAGQFITLWQVDGLNIQLDFELVDFSNGSPTEWSQFSHSSSWEDIEEGIKGVFHKYALRALSTMNLRDVIILKGKKQTPKKITTTDLAFSVQRGLRQKIEPVYDERGNQQVMDGLFVFREIPSSESDYITELRSMFKIFFNTTPSSKELNEFGSFIGILNLVDHYWSTDKKRNFHKGFANTLWGQGAQALVRGSANEDYKFKMTAYQKLINALGLKETSTVKDWRKSYYESY